MQQLSLGLRLVLVVLSYVAYLQMLVWPVDLAPYYGDRFHWTIFAGMTSVIILFLIR
jgi:hypothetical protein